MKSLYTFLCIALSVLSLNAQNTYVPDDNFEQALIDLGYDSGPLDDYVPTANINAVFWLNVNAKEISDLTGIEDFTMLTELRCSNNDLTNLNVSNNTALKKLFCSYNSLTSLDISNNTDLLTLDIHVNSLTSIDVSNNIFLDNLICNDNSLTSLDISNNNALKFLSAGSNNLSSLDVSNNTDLLTLDIHTNSLTNIDVGNNTAITVLRIYDNDLMSLDVSNNTALFHLECHTNNLTSLDVKSNLVLRNLYCYSNHIDRLNLVKNQSLEILNCGNNDLIGINLKDGKPETNITFFNAESNPNLECIQVDDPAYCTANFTNIDPASSFRKKCNYVATYGNRIDQTVAQDQELEIYPNPITSSLTISTVDNALYTLRAIDGKMVLNGTIPYGSKTIDCSHLQSGLYILTVNNGGVEVQKKIIKK